MDERPEQGRLCHHLSPPDPRSSARGARASEPAWRPLRKPKRRLTAVPAGTAGPTGSAAASGHGPPRTPARGTGHRPPPRRLRAGAGWAGLGARGIQAQPGQAAAGPALPHLFLRREPASTSWRGAPQQGGPGCLSAGGRLCPASPGGPRQGREGKRKSLARCGCRDRCALASETRAQDAAAQREGAGKGKGKGKRRLPGAHARLRGGPRAGRGPSPAPPEFTHLPLPGAHDAVSAPGSCQLALSRESWGCN